MYPYLRERTVLTVKGFSPEEFIVYKLVYEMYLDYENEVITCYVQAVYKEKKYSLVSNEDLEKRDKEDEENVAQIMAPMFDSFNPIDRLLLFRVKEEADLFDLLSEKIPALHQLGTVYVSDSLNKFRVV